jgi:hypothetical protein
LGPRGIFRYILLMMHRPVALALAAGCGLAVLAGGGAALAQPSPENRAAAAALFEDGIRLMGEGKVAEACPKLEESQRIDPGMGTLYRLSLCFEESGRTASAWVGFREVAGLAQAAGQAEREKAARGKASALEPRLIRLKITVQPATASAGVEVKRDGAVVSPALWGTSVPLDPGRHKVSAAAPGKEPWEVAVQLDQPGATVTVDVPPLLEKKAGGSTILAPTDKPPAGQPAQQGPGTPPPPVEGRSPRPWQMPLGIVATVVGVAGLGMGTALGFMAKSEFNLSNSSGNCNAATAVCNPTGLTQRSDAVGKGNIGTGVFVAGAVVAAGGIVLWATAPSRAASVQVGVGPTGGSLRGAF